MNDKLIELKNVDKTYVSGSTKVRALQKINLTISKGSFTAVTGPSGSGKSTLLNMITGIDIPTSGDVLINDIKINTLSETKRTTVRGKNIGIVFQFFQLIPTLSILDNIMLPMDLLGIVLQKKRRSRAKELLELVGILGEAHRLPADISGGQQQRAAIARSLANDPPLIVADEPTGNLDSETTELIFDLFSSLVLQNKTVLLITHEREIASRVSHSITLKDGMLLQNTQEKSEKKYKKSRVYNVPQQS